MTDQQINDLISRHEVHEYHPGAILEFARELLAMAAPSLTVGERVDTTVERLLRHALEAIEAGASAHIVMNVEGLKQNIRRHLVSMFEPKPENDDLTIAYMTGAHDARRAAQQALSDLECPPGPETVDRALQQPPQPAAQAEPVARIDPMQDPMRPVSFIGAIEDETPAELVLRKLACWLGVGGYNADKVDADSYHRKIVEAVEQISKRPAPPAAPKAVGEVAPHPDVVDWYSEEPPLGTKLYTAQAGAELPDAMSYAAARNWAVTKEWARGFNDARTAMASNPPAQGGTPVASEP